MMMNRFLLRSFSAALLLAASAGSLSAQQISLHFPHFSGKHWDFILLKGVTLDTVLSGVIPEDGRVNLYLPENHKNYVGMSRWLLREGGGIDLILNKENFSVECLSDQPNEDNIIYKGSAENDFLHQNHREQDKLLLQYDAIRQLENAYPQDSPLHKAAIEEKMRIEQAWDDFRTKLNASPLYAARFREIVDFTRGIGSKLQQTEAEKAADLNSLLCRQLSWDVLHTSNHWSGVIYSWVQLHSEVLKDKATLISSARQILNRLPNPTLYTDFCEKMVTYMVKFGQDDAIAALGPEILGSGKLLHTDGLLAQLQSKSQGEVLPDLILLDRVTRQANGQYLATVLKTGELSPVGSLIVFYQSGCGPCAQTLEDLEKHHTTFESRRIRLVSLSADKDIAEFEQTALKIPWKDNYCDGQGFEGVNFRSYGVAGTPTLILLDPAGRQLLRTATVSEVLEFLDKGTRP